IPVAVENESRQTVGLAEYEPIVRLAVESLPQSERCPQPRLDELATDGMGGVPAEDARADERVRVDVGIAEELAPLRLDLREIARRERRQRRRVGIDLIAEDPQMSRGQAPLFAASGVAHGRGRHRRWMWLQESSRQAR